MKKMLVYFILFVLPQLTFTQTGEAKDINTRNETGTKPGKSLIDADNYRYEMTAGLFLPPSAALKYGVLILLGVLFPGIVVLYTRKHFFARLNRDLLEQIDLQAACIKEQQESLGACLSKIQKQHEKIEKDSALKNRLVSMLAHDIITPLRFMNRAGLMLAESRDRISEDTYHETIQTIKETGDNLRHMTENMLNWVRHHQEQLKFSATPIELSNTIEDITKAIQSTAIAKEVIINNKVKAGLSLYQYADPLKTIIQQLIANAVKFSEKGKIIASAEVENNIVTVTVKDEGMGMPPDMISHLTEAGMVNDFTNAYENKGHGFGLLIVKQMLRIMNGTLNIESGVNKGTTVSVSFPQRLAVA